MSFPFIPVSVFSITVIPAFKCFLYYSSQHISVAQYIHSSISILSLPFKPVYQFFLLYLYQHISVIHIHPHILVVSILFISAYHISVVYSIHPSKSVLSVHSSQYISFVYSHPIIQAYQCYIHSSRQISVVYTIPPSISVLRIHSSQHISVVYPFIPVYHCCVFHSSHSQHHIVAYSIVPPYTSVLPIVFTAPYSPPACCQLIPCTHHSTGLPIYSINNSIFIIVYKSVLLFIRHMPQHYFHLSLPSALQLKGQFPFMYSQK